MSVTRRNLLKTADIELAILGFNKLLFESNLNKYLKQDDDKKEALIEKVFFENYIKINTIYGIL